MAFLERIIAVNEKNEIYRKSNKEKVQEKIYSIKRNLEVILNSKQGCAACAPCFGLNDFNDSTNSSKSLCVEIVSDIKNNIEKFEPRVKINRIEYLENDCPGALTFRLSCDVKFKDNSQLSEFDLVLNNISQKFSVV